MFDYNIIGEFVNIFSLNSTKIKKHFIEGFFERCNINKNVCTFLKYFSWQLQDQSEQRASSCKLHCH